MSFRPSKPPTTEISGPVYIATRISEWNAEEPGKGDQWLNTWNGARGGDFTESKYEKAYYTAGYLLGKYLEKEVYE